VTTDHLRDDDTISSDLQKRVTGRPKGEEKAKCKSCLRKDAEQKVGTSGKTNYFRPLRLIYVPVSYHNLVASGEEIAIKSESKSSRYFHLQNECNMHKAIGNHPSVPQFKWYGEEHNRRLLVLSLLGPSLQDVFVASHCKFKLDTVLGIARQIVRSIFSFYSIIIICHVLP
jgi:serine/threonine protein kinase